MLAKPDFDRWLARLRVEVLANDDLAHSALEAYLKFGQRRIIAPA